MRIVVDNPIRGDAVRPIAPVPPPSAEHGSGGTETVADPVGWREAHPYVPVHANAPDANRECIRRVLNAVLAAAILVVIAPLMLLIALLVKLTSPGPVLYKQMRVGADRRSRSRAVAGCRRSVDCGGALFELYKFRTMYDGADGDGESWAQPDDPRVTRLGRILRRYRLDELPQLVNVLKGDMNIVGPRPEQPEIFAALSERIDGYVERQKVLPGITGWAQINHQYDQTLDDVRVKLGYDLEYVERCCAMEDLKIMARTLPVMLHCHGAL